MKSRNGGFMWQAVDQLAISIAETNIQATNGGIGILSTIIEIQRESFNALDAVLEESKVEEASRLEGFVLAAADAMFLGAVQCIPLAGPLIAQATSALASTLITSMLPAVTTATVAGISGATTPGNSTNGVATLCVTAIRQYRKKSEEEILQNPALSQPYVNNMRDLTQNQTASKSINTLDRARINTYNQKFVGIFPKTALYQDKDSTIKSFKKRTFNLYAGAREMMLDVINAGVQGSFKDAIAKLPQNDNRLDDNRRIALLIIGYFFAKDWNAKELTDQVGSIQRRLDTAQSLPSAQTQLGQGNISRLQRELQSANSKIVAPQNAPAPSPTSLKQWDGQLQAGTVNIGRGASSALELARSVASKKLGGFSTMGLAEGEQRDTQMMSTIQPKAAAYFRAMKAAMVGDVETVLTKTYSGSTLSSEEYKKIWYLYVGSQLILNDSFRQLKVHANTNSFGSLFRKISSVNTISISKQHVDMIRKAGFIHDYNKGISLSQDQKKAFASGAVTGAKLRWSSNPSNTEQAMLLAFCTIVVYTMDVGAITLGMYNWKETKENLGKACKRISWTVINNQGP
ncbi:hypothetical protein [Methylobacterium oryzihabitans]|uniref:Uncharacterized protein n=1 Tax=Methylobacterium oryzihabitans TaxID=2499852 RepID=A0A437P3Y2_9HYPH|nr:hypothetical protein [Methylobacterium oryzihabitans]RVU16936.1 hypothetical protein EOE48_15885 [Methylobacterium oryzihabitans]